MRYNGDPEDIQTHRKWLRDPKPQLESFSHLYEGKTVKNIMYYGNGESLINFTDGTRLLFSVEDPISGGDLYHKTEVEFDFERWQYRDDTSEIP